MIKIRKATVEDARGISELIVPLAKKYVCPTCEDSMHELLLRSMSESNIRQYISDNHSYHVAVDDDGDIQGVIGIRGYSHLYHLFVHDDFQGHGISRKLWEKAKADGISKNKCGCFTVNSAVNVENVYLSFGFKRIEGIRNRAGMKDIPMILEGVSG